MIQRALFTEVGLFDENLPACEDYDLWLKICARYPVLYVDRPLVIKTGGHADQLSRRYWGMDRFRIQALENILAAGVLGKQDHAATLHTLQQKLAILIKGAVKRDNHTLAGQYRDRLSRHPRLQQLADNA